MSEQDRDDYAGYDYPDEEIIFHDNKPGEK